MLILQMHFLEFSSYQWINCHFSKLEVLLVMLNRHSLASHLQLYFIKIKLCGKLKVNQLIYIYFNCMFVLFRTGLCQDDVQLVYNYLTTKLFPASLSLNPEGRSVKIEKILTKLNWLQKIFLKIFDRAYRCS